MATATMKPIMLKIVMMVVTVVVMMLIQTIALFVDVTLKTPVLLEYILWSVMGIVMMKPTIQLVATMVVTAVDLASSKSTAPIVHARMSLVKMKFLLQLEMAFAMMKQILLPATMMVVTVVAHMFLVSDLIHLCSTRLKINL